MKDSLASQDKRISGLCDTDECTKKDDKEQMEHWTESTKYHMTMQTRDGMSGPVR